MQQGTIGMSRWADFTRWAKSVFVQDQYEQLKADLFADPVFDGAASLAYYLTLAIFPGLIFVFTLMPYLSIPDLTNILSHDIFNVLPTRVASTLQTSIMQVMNHPNYSVTFLSFFFGLFAASSGAAAVMRQMNIAYEVRERRTFLRTRLVALALTLIFSLILVSSLVVIVVGGLFVSDFWLSALRWVVILITVYTGLSTVYYIGPDTFHLQQRFRYFTPGSWLGTILILVATGGLSLYLQYFDSYNKIYGSIAGVIVLMIWFYLVGMAILMGAVLNHFIYKKLY